MNIFDEVFKKPEDKLKVIKSALNRTYLGAGNILQVDIEDGDRIVYKLTATGETIDDLKTAAEKAAGMYLSQVTNLNSDQIKAAGKLSGPASIMQSISSKKFTDDQRKTLEAAGIDVDGLNKLEVHVITMAGKTDTKNMAQKIIDLQERGALDGITVIDDESARLLVFRSNGKMLSQYQSSLLMRVAGHGLISEEILSKPESYSKIPKRFRTIFSERLVSLAGDDLAGYLGVENISSVTKNLADDFAQRTLVTDPQFEMLLKSASKQGSSFQNLLGQFYGDSQKVAALRQYYKGKITDNYFGTYFEQLEKIGKKDEFLDIIRNFAQSNEAKNNTGYLSDALEDHFKRLKEERKVSKEVYDIFDKIYKEIEYTFDGSDLLNAKHFERYKKQLREESQKLAGQIELTPDNNDLKIAKKDIDDVLGQIEGSKYDQITGRGRIKLPNGQFADIKTAFSILYGKESSFRGDLQGFAAIISKFGTKKELGIAGETPMLLLSGFGSGRMDVLSDPVSLAFHPEIFADKETLESMRLRSSAVAQEFQAVLQQNVLPQEVRKMLESQIESSQVIESLPQHQRASALRNRQFAESILEMHRSGMSPRDTPAMANMLHKLYSTQVFTASYDRYGNLRYSTVLPDTYRFALDTEKTLNRSDLGRGFEKMTVAMEDGRKASGDVAKFRIKGNKLYFGTEVMSTIRESLGGFDLDDKGIAKIFKYTDDNGMTRIAFNLTRQPSGIDEKMIARAYLDEDTVRGLFTKNRGEKIFRSSLEELISQSPNDDRYERFLDILNNKKLNDQLDQDNLEKVIIDVYDQMEKTGRTVISRFDERSFSRFQKFGFSALQGEEPKYSRAGIYKIFTKNDDIGLISEIKTAAKKATQTSQITNFLNEISSGKIATTQDAIVALRNLGQEGMAVIDTAFQMRGISAAAEGADILGAYINRSMLVGSTLNQYGDIFNTLDETQKNFLLLKYSIGMLSQEEAIDLSVQGLTSSKILDVSKMREKLAAAAEFASMATTGEFSLSSVQQSIENIFGGEKKLGINMIGDEAIKNVGGLIGALKVLGQGTLGIDKVLLEQRLTEKDSKVLLENIISGMEETGRHFGIDVSEHVKELSPFLIRSEETIKETLISKFGIGAESEYASLAKITELARQEELIFESINKTFKNSLYDDILNATITSDRADTLARRIILDNKKVLDNIFLRSANEVKNMSTQDAVMHNAQKAAVSQRMLTAINEGSRIKGMTLEDLVNALDKIKAETGVDIGRFEAINAGVVDDELFNLQLRIQQARTKRTVKYFTALKTNEAQEFIDNLNLTDRTYQGFLDAVQQQLSAATDPDSANAQIARAVLGQAEQIDDATVRAQAQRQANIARSLILQEQNEQVYDELARTGTIDTVVDDYEYLTDDLIKSVDNLESDDTTNQAVYKRFSQKIQDNELSKLFKDPIIRRGSMAIGALVLGSFVYTAAKDRSKDDMTGPPLLPGGSAYEQNYPVRVPEIGSFGGQGYNSGMSYNVSINGSYEDLQRFNEAARGLVNGSTSTTIYEGLPNMTQDPYRRMASEY